MPTVITPATARELSSNIIAPIAMPPSNKRRIIDDDDDEVELSDEHVAVMSMAFLWLSFCRFRTKILLQVFIQSLCVVS